MSSKNIATLSILKEWTAVQRNMGISSTLQAFQPLVSMLAKMGLNLITFPSPQSTILRIIAFQVLIQMLIATG